MKIVFLCGSLEPGRDGVGDYTRRLAGELIRQGHSVSIVALNDRHLGLDGSDATCFASEAESAIVEDADDSHTQMSDGTPVPVLRLSSQMSWPDRMRIVRRFVDQLDPAWISLQFVPFSFHRKGLCYRFAFRLRPLSQGRSTSITFHEAHCCGLLGKLQIPAIRLLTFCIKPKLAFYAARGYRSELKRYGIPLHELPIPSCIPVKPQRLEWLAEKLGISQEQRRERFVAVFFGTLVGRRNAYRKTLMQIRSQLPDEQCLSIVHVGNCNSSAIHQLEVTVLSMENTEFHVLGRLSSEDVSQTLQSADVGVTHYSPDWVGKSSSVAAMIEHGLMVFGESMQLTPSPSGPNDIESIAIAMLQEFEGHAE